MALNILSTLYLLIVVALIWCDIVVSLGSIFAEDNPIRIVSHADFYNEEIPHRIYSKHNTIIKEIYQFGDSISDTGNSVQDSPLNICGKFPYGKSLNNTPTGRCSDGLLMIDYFTKFFNLPLLDPYLNKNGNFNYGVNFAVGGATALNCSTLTLKNIFCPTHCSLLVQLDWFKSHLNSICSSASDCKEKLATALVVMGEIGGNDYNYALLEQKKIAEIYKLVPEVIQIIKHTIKEIINLGVIRVVVPGNFPIGCVPMYLKMYKTNDSRMYDEFQCLEYLNDFAKFHNDKLQEAIRELQKDYPNITIIYADYLLALKDILRDATSLGFDKDIVEKACCGLCFGSGEGICENPYKYISWDGIHFTQHVYQLMAQWLIKNSFQEFYHGVRQCNIR